VTLVLAATTFLRRRFVTGCLRWRPHLQAAMAANQSASGEAVMRSTMSKTFAAVLVVVVWQAFGDMTVAGAYSRLVVFGDSVTDPGNAFTLLHTSAVPPFVPVPGVPYARGGHHFSNGATWVEQLGATLHLNPSPGPALQHPVVFSNYAVGGSRARVHLALQVNRFLADFGGVAPSDALYVVHIGSDDLRDALVALQTDPTFATSTAIIADALAAIQASITALASSGARTFLVPNAPDLALVPEVRAADAQVPGTALVATLLASKFNDGLETTLSGLEALLSVTIARLDIFELIHEIVAAPAAFGLTDVENPCITPFTRVSPYCAQPDRFLFWDFIHATRAGHAIISHRALDVLGAL
jgi:outer membrane lipase/esterase